MLTLNNSKSNNCFFIYFIIAINIGIFLYINEYRNTSEIEYLNVYYGLNLHTMNSPLNWITNAFMHANYVHLGMNMFFFYVLGFQLLEQVHKFKLILVYILSMIGASLFSYLYISNSSEIINVLGASGAIFGVFAYLMFVINQVKSFFIQLVVFHVGVVAMDMPIAWYGHLGGAIVGIILFYIIERNR